MSGMFMQDRIKSLDLSNFDTSKVTDMSSMFSGCSELTSLDLSSFDTGRVEGMNEMFQDCSSLESLDLSGFDTKSLKDYNTMFLGANKLEKLTLGKGFREVILEMMLTNSGKWFAESNKTAPVSGEANYAVIKNSEKTTYLRAADSKKEEEYLLGDVNGDKQVDSKDATAILIAYADALVNDTTIKAADMPAGDYNKDGEVNSLDATAILIAYAEYLVNL
jgi:surface protein